MKNNVKTFRKVIVHLPQYPDIKKIYSYEERKIYINNDARPGANVILLEPARDRRDPLLWRN